MQAFYEERGLGGRIKRRAVKARSMVAREETAPKIARTRTSAAPGDSTSRRTRKPRRRVYVDWSGLSRFSGRVLGSGRANIIGLVSLCLLAATCASRTELSIPNPLDGRAFAASSGSLTGASLADAERESEPAYRFGLPIWQSDILALNADCGPVRLVSDLGPRRNPFGSGTQIHYGLDAAPPLCDGAMMDESLAIRIPIRAVESGVVISYGSGGARYGAARGGGSYGHNLVVIGRPDGDRTCGWREQDQGAMVVRYGHMSRPMTERGEDPVCRWVEEGDIVGYMGGTGRSQNLHLDIRAGNVTLAQRGDTWVPSQIRYVNLAAPGMMEPDVFAVNPGLNLNVSPQTYEVAYGGARRRVDRAVVVDEPIVTTVDEEDIDDTHEDDLPGDDLKIEGDSVLVAAFGEEQPLGIPLGVYNATQSGMPLSLLRPDEGPLMANTGVGELSQPLP